jgi:hypothetical protein
MRLPEPSPIKFRAPDFCLEKHKQQKIDLFRPSNPEWSPSKSEVNLEISSMVKEIIIVAQNVNIRLRGSALLLPQILISFQTWNTL